MAIFFIDISMVVPLLVTVFIPVMLLVYVMRKDIRWALGDALYISMAYATLTGLLIYIIIPIFPQLGELIIGLSDPLYNLFIGIMGGLSYLLLMLVLRRPVTWRTRELWYVMAVIIAGKFIMQATLPMVTTMSLI